MISLIIFLYNVVSNYICVSSELRLVSLWRIQFSAVPPIKGRLAATIRSSEVRSSPGRTAVLNYDENLSSDNDGHE